MASNSSILAHHVQYGRDWGTHVLQQWYEKHPQARELIAELSYDMDDSMLIDWICDSEQQSKWENYKRGVKYLENCRPRYLKYFNGSIPLYIRVVKRIFCPEFFEKFQPELLDSFDFKEED